MSRRNENKRQPAGRLKRNVRRHPPFMSTKIFAEAALREQRRRLLFQKLYREGGWYA